MPVGRQTSKSLIQIDIAGLGACIAITAVAYMMIYQPLAQAQQQKEAQQIEVTSREEKATQLTATINDLRQDLSKLQSSALADPIELHSAQHSNQRLADLTQLAADHKLTIHEMRTGAISAAPANRYDIVPIHILGAGTFQTCTSFLNQVRSRFPDTGVTGLELSDNPSDPEDLTAFKFDLSWYAATTLTSANK